VAIRRAFVLDIVIAVNASHNHGLIAPLRGVLPDLATRAAPLRRPKTA